MSSRADVTVAAVVERTGRFLVVEERCSGRYVYNQPAGHVEARETLLDAVVREAREETAWEFVPDALLGVYLWRNARNGKTTMRFTFAGDVAHHDPAQPLDTGIVGTHWLTRDELVGRAQALRSPLVLRCIDDYLAGQRQPLDGVASLDLESARSVAAVRIA